MPRRSPIPEGVASYLATPQAGAVSWSQLRDAGLGPHVITRCASNGHLHRVHRGVYIPGHLALAPLARESAALLACGEHALLSHASAAYVWRLVRHAPAEVHVTVVGRHRRQRLGICVHQVTALDSRDRRTNYGLPLTAPARTLIDLAATATTDELDRAVSEARALTLIRDGDLAAALERAGKRAGVGVLRAFLAGEHGTGFTRSEAERRMRRLAKAAHLPAPVCNGRAAGWEVDFLWPAQRLVVEVDSYGFHGHRAAFERDRRKGLALVAAGYRVIRITWRQLKHEPLLVAAQLAQALVAER